MKADIQCILILVQKQCEYTHWPTHNLEVRSVFNLEVSSGFNLEKRSGINNCVPSRNFIDFPFFFLSRDFFLINGHCTAFYDSVFYLLPEIDVLRKKEEGSRRE